ncbi:MAG: hypothetical protein QM751_08210 [Paludibacteraceae bacterium]
MIDYFATLTSESSSFGAPMAKTMKKMLVKQNLTPLQKTIIASEKWGKWVWNPKINDFQKKENFYTEKLVFEFPSTATSETNDAQLTFNYVNSSTIIPESDNVYYPAKVEVLLIKDETTTLIDASVTCKFNSDGLPSSVIQKLVVDKFSINTNVANTGTNVSSSMNFSYDKTKLIGYDFKSDGKFSNEIFNNIEDVPEDIVSNANLTFNAMNIGLVGSVTDFKGMLQAIKNLDSNKLTEKQYTQQIADILNQYLKMFGYFIDDNKKFADVEFFLDTYTDTYTYYTYVYNSQTGQYDKIEQTDTDTYHEVGVRFVMNDGSKINAEDYIQRGFEDFKTKLDDILSKYK